MMNNTAKMLLMTAMLPLGASAEQQLLPWYVGAGAGINNYQPHCDQKTMKSCDKDDPWAWDVFAGYMVDDYFGIQLGYTNLGRVKWTGYDNVRNDVGAKGVTLGLVGVYPFAQRWSVSAEAGAFNYHLSNKRQYGSQYYSDNDFGPYFGVGLGFNITENVKLQAKYRRYQDLDDKKWNTLDMESNYWGIEFSYRFGRQIAVIAPVITSLDSDHDGVINSLDKCPNTPITHRVDAEGCTIYLEITELQNLGVLEFANNSAVVKESSYGRIEELATYLNKHPQSTILIAGYASDIGKADYNLALSDRRANAVAKLLVEKYGINQERVTAKGFGINNPLMQGHIPEANKLNRRIEAIVTHVTIVP